MFLFSFLTQEPARRSSELLDLLMLSSLRLFIYRVILFLEAPNYGVYKNYIMFIYQLTDHELTTGYYQQDGATCHTSMPACERFIVFLKKELSQKTFGHPDLPI